MSTSCPDSPSMVIRSMPPPAMGSPCSSFPTSAAFRTLPILLLALAACSKAPPAQAELEQQFEKMMNGATLVGRSTRLNRDGVAPGEERYAIEKVSKLSGDTWLIRARMKYGSHDVPVPVPVT